MSLSVILNGQPREFEQLEAGAPLETVVNALELKADRIAIEHNGEIAQRGTWEQASVNPGDRLEIVHFVGGGIGQDSNGRVLSGREPVDIVTLHNICYRT